MTVNGTISAGPRPRSSGHNPMENQQKLNFYDSQFEKLYQQLRAMGCKGTADYPDHKAFLNRDRKVEKVREPAMSESMLAPAISTQGTIQRPMFGDRS
jgi:hypothetical protein